MKRRRTASIAMAVGITAAMLFGAASASGAEFTVSNVGANLAETTLEEHVFQVTGADVECDDIEFEGKGPMGHRAGSLVVHPVYDNCTAYGFAGADIDTPGCSYVFDADGLTTIQGCTLNGILITVSNFFATCKVHIPNQEGIGGPGYFNVGNHIDMTFNMSGIKAEVLVSTGLCALKVGNHVNGTYTGESTLQAEGSLAHIP